MTADNSASKTNQAGKEYEKQPLTKPFASSKNAHHKRKGQEHLELHRPY